MRMPSLQDLFSLMVSRGSQTAADALADMPEDSVLLPTSLRLHPRTRAYYEAQAQACGAPSASAMMGMVLEGVMMATRPQEEITSSEAVREGVELVRDRFLHLFRVHGFTPHMIVDVLRPHGVGLVELGSDTKLLSLLSEDVLAEQAKRFGVEVDWLYGKPVSPIRSTHRLDRNPYWFAKTIAELLHEDGRELTVLFLRQKDLSLQAAFESDGNSGGDVGMVVRQTCRTPGGKTYHRYQAWNTVPWAYRETRLSLKVVILWLQKLDAETYYKTNFYGVEVDERVLYAICNHGSLPAEGLEQKGPYNSLKRWDPEDYVMDPMHTHIAKEAIEWPTAHEYFLHYKMGETFTLLAPLLRPNYLAHNITNFDKGQGRPSEG